MGFSKRFLKYAGFGLGSGLILNFATAPYDQGYLGFIAFLPLFLTFDQGFRVRWFTGWCAGFTAQALGYFWIFITIRDFGGQGSLASAIGAFSFWAYQGLDVAVWLGVAPLVCGRLPHWARPVAAAAFWYLLQAQWFPYVFPWNYGNTFTSLMSVGQGALLWAAPGLGFFALLFQGALVLPKKNSIRWLLLLGSVLPLTATWFMAKEVQTETWRVGVIQPNIIPWAKQGRLNTMQFFEAHYRPTAMLADQNVDLVVWPETALPFDLKEQGPMLAALGELAKKMQIAIVIGTVSPAGDGSFRNEIWMVTPDDQAPQVYGKRKLVWFSEKLPWLFSWLKNIDPGLGAFSAGEEDRLFYYRDRKWVPLICFEALFPDYVRRRQGDVLLNLTNDAWFGKTKASWQHLQQIQLRAVEMQVPMVRAANSGVSCVVDRKGQIVAKGGIYTKETFVFEVDLATKAIAPISHVGTYLLMGLSYAMVFWGTWLAFRHRFGNRKRASVN